MPLKDQLYELCKKYVEQRIDTARDAIATLQAAANEETKSSAGDKYETGRAMMQLEIEKNATQLNEAQKLSEALHKIDPRKQTEKIQAGSLVITSHGNFFISIGAGELVLDKKSFFAIAPTSPIGIQLTGKSVGMAFVFNKKNYIIHEVC
jgi:hypothetical protein